MQQRRMMTEREHPSLSLSAQCRLLALSRSTLYYQPEGHSAETLALMRRIDELYLKYPFYGSRQMARHLAREKVTVGRHRVRRLMRLLGLEAIYRKPRTTVANPEHRVYPYLLRGVAIEQANHVWCADITYIPVQGGFLYLVAVMDWATRRVLTWRLSNTMDTEFCLEALSEALQRYGTPQIFNTDQGSQFTSTAFTASVGGRRHPVFDGRPRPVSGQRVHRTAVAIAEVRGGVPARAGRRLRGAAADRRLDGVLQWSPPALGARWPHAGRSVRRSRAGTRKGGGIVDMDIRWRQRATRVSAGDVVHELWNLSTVSTGSITPSPEPPPPFTAACFSRRRGRLTTNGLHLNLPLELSNEPGPPQVPRVSCLYPMASAGAEETGKCTQQAPGGS